MRLIDGGAIGIGVGDDERLSAHDVGEESSMPLETERDHERRLDRHAQADAEQQHVVASNSFGADVADPFDGVHTRQVRDRR